MAEQAPRQPPLPGESFPLRYTTLAPQQIYHRFHMARFGATAFNDTAAGQARFSPIRNRNGAIIPTLYGAQTLECAAMR